jgi:hypothetical protein
MRDLYFTMAQSALACSRNPALACRLRIVNLYPWAEHEVRCIRLQSPVNAVMIDRTVPPRMSISPHSYHAAECPLAMLDQEARSHKPCQYLLHRSRLSRQWLGVHDTMIVADDCRRSEGIEICNWKEIRLMNSWNSGERE